MVRHCAAVARALSWQGAVIAVLVAGAGSSCGGVAPRASGPRPAKHLVPFSSASVAPLLAPVRLDPIETTCAEFETDDWGTILVDTSGVADCCAADETARGALTRRCRWRAVDSTGAIGEEIEYTRGLPDVDLDFSDIRGGDRIRVLAQGDGKAWVVHARREGSELIYSGSPAGWAKHSEVEGTIVGAGRWTGSSVLLAVADADEARVKLLEGAPTMVPKLPPPTSVRLGSVRFHPSGWAFATGQLMVPGEWGPRRSHAALLHWTPGSAEPVITPLPQHELVEADAWRRYLVVDEVAVLSPSEVYAVLKLSTHASVQPLHVYRFDGRAWKLSARLDGRLVAGPKVGADGAVWLQLDGPGKPLWYRQPGDPDRWSAIDLDQLYGAMLSHRLDGFLPVGDHDALLILMTERGRGIFRLRMGQLEAVP